jgi:hypothetical protein
MLCSFGPGLVRTASAFSSKSVYSGTFRTSVNDERVIKFRSDSVTSMLSATSIELSGERETVKVQRKYETFRWFHNETSSEYDINYRVEGEGPPILLVLVHGFGANINHFRFQFPALVEQGYRVHAVDLLGFGASDKPGEPEYSIELFVQLLKDFIEHKREGEKWFACCGKFYRWTLQLGTDRAATRGCERRHLVQLCWGHDGVSIRRCSHLCPTNFVFHSKGCLGTPTWWPILCKFQDTRKRRIHFESPGRPSMEIPLMSMQCY